MLDAVFEPWVQVDRSERGAQRGLGLGLSVAKRLIELHGGQIEARSAGEGNGSEFAIRLALDEGPDTSPT